MKQKVHSSYMGIESTLRRARECIFWPGMSLDIKQLTEACETCCKFEAKHTEGISDASWYATPTLGKVGTNLFELNNKDYLVTVDYYSNFFEIDKLEDTKPVQSFKSLRAISHDTVPWIKLCLTVGPNSQVTTLHSLPENGSLTTTRAAQLVTAKQMAKQSLQSRLPNDSCKKSPMHKRTLT